MIIDRWGCYSIAVNVTLMVINAGLATVSGSLAVEAEMVHNVVDLLTAIGVLMGLKLSTQKSKTFPYRAVRTLPRPWHANGGGGGGDCYEGEQVEGHAAENLRKAACTSSKAL